MDYEKLNLKDGDILKAEHLAHIEAGIANACSANPGRIVVHFDVADDFTTITGANWTFADLYQRYILGADIAAEIWGNNSETATYLNLVSASAYQLEFCYIAYSDYTGTGVSAGMYLTMYQDNTYRLVFDDIDAIMQGSTPSSAGTSGLVPAPAAGDEGKFLRGDGTWAEVSGGGGGQEIFVATYGTTTCAELEAAWQAGKVLFVLYNNSYMPLVERYGANSFYFSGVKYDVMLTAYCSYNKWYNYSYAFLPYSEYSEYEFDQYAYRLGDVVMAYEYAPHHVSCLRNTKLVSSEEYPANEGEIFWQYE